MSKATTATCAFALALAWAVAPASAQTTPPTPEQKADQIEKKTEQKADQIEKKADQQADQVRKEGDRQADQVRGKTRDGSDTAGGKLERAWDKTKAKAREARDKVTGGDDGRRADADVRSAQMALRDRGYDPGAIDGVMGPRTSAAVRDFQQKENLAVTGQLDAETRAKLDAAPSASPATSEKAGSQQSQRQ
ncbi:MAG TPA: peptidoglycan-binding protein [Methylomirabilota bacterium]|nr:peptidoglycan-binding protein [Methylomirabilota bacterium]